MDAALQKLMAEAEKSTDELVDLHRHLVRIPTVNTGVHGVDEVISVENLVIKTKMQAALAYLALGEW